MEKNRSFDLKKTGTENMNPLRNFDLSVDEIKLVRSIKQLKETLERIQLKEPSSPRTVYILKEIESLEEKLEQVRENTLIG